jgi:4-hydroxybenzoate polyprenyltransferase
MNTDSIRPEIGDQKIKDAERGNWVDDLAPIGWRPYLRLARLDRPIGTWLLFWPCAWGAAMVGQPWPNFWHLILFGMGALVMRGAGCTFNDIIDRDIDRKVARTALRPLASGAIGLSGAIVFLVAQSLIGALVLFQFNLFTIGLGITALLPVAIYPFMKRVTWWPQAFLGIAFNWGVMVGAAATSMTLSLATVLAYLAGIAWTIGYDTIYAHQDREDDALIGVKSTARLFGSRTRAAIAGFYAATIVLLGLSGLAGSASGLFWLGLCAPTAHLAWQTIALRANDPDNCLMIFRSNRMTGGLIFLTFILGRIDMAG